MSDTEPRFKNATDAIKYFESLKSKEEEHKANKRKFSPSKNNGKYMRHKVDTAKYDKNFHLSVIKVTHNAILPKLIVNGYDIYSASDSVIPAYGDAIIITDIKIELPESTHGRIVSGNVLEVKSFIGVNSLEPLKVTLYNNSEVDVKVKKGEQFAKLVIEMYCTPEVFEVK